MRWPASRGTTTQFTRSRRTASSTGGEPTSAANSETACVGTRARSPSRSSRSDHTRDGALPPDHRLGRVLQLPEVETCRAEARPSAVSPWRELGRPPRLLRQSALYLQEALRAGGLARSRGNRPNLF